MLGHIFFSIAQAGLATLRIARWVANPRRAYTAHTLNAFKDVAAANVDKVTLEFGVKSL